MRERLDLKVLKNEDFHRSKSSGIYQTWVFHDLLETKNLFLKDLFTKHDLNLRLNVDSQKKAQKWSKGCSRDLNIDTHAPWSQFVCCPLDWALTRQPRSGPHKGVPPRELLPSVSIYVEEGLHNIDHTAWTSVKQICTYIVHT